MVAIVTTNIALIGWLRSDIKGFESEMKKDRKDFESEMKKDLKDFVSELKKDRKDFEIKLEYWQESISREMKDFHGRLCTQEEKFRHIKSPSDKQT